MKFHWIGFIMIGLASCQPALPTEQVFPVLGKPKLVIDEQGAYSLQAHVIRDGTGDYNTFGFRIYESDDYLSISRTQWETADREGDIIKADISSEVVNGYSYEVFPYATDGVQTVYGEVDLFTFEKSLNTKWSLHDPGFTLITESDWGAQIEIIDYLGTNYFKRGRRPWYKGNPTTLSFTSVDPPIGLLESYNNDAFVAEAAGTGFLVNRNVSNIYELDGGPNRRFFMEFPFERSNVNWVEGIEDDLYVFSFSRTSIRIDVKTKQWVELSQLPDALPYGYFQSSIVKDGFLYLFKGNDQYKYNTVTDEWSSIQLEAPDSFEYDFDQILEINGRYFVIVERFSWYNDDQYLKIWELFPEEERVEYVSYLPISKRFSISSTGNVAACSSDGDIFVFRYLGPDLFEVWKYEL